MICYLRHKRDKFFRTDILSKKRNLVTIFSSLWTRCTIKKIHMRTFTLMWQPPPPVHISSHFYGLYLDYSIFVGSFNFSSFVLIPKIVCRQCKVFSLKPIKPNKLNQSKTTILLLMKLGDEPIFLNWVSLHARLKSHHEGWRYKKKKKVKIIQELYKEPCLLTLDLKPFISYIKGKHTAGKEFQSLAVWGKELLT